MHLFRSRRGAPSALALACLALGCTSTPSTTDTGPLDGGPDAAPDVDSAVSFVSMTAITTLSENCMPAVPADPMSIDGSLSVTNTGASSIGPVQVSEGQVVRLLGGDTIATFAIAPIDLGTIAPGATATAPFAKTAGSLAGGSGLTGCDIVACDTPVRIELVLTGTHVPPGTRAASEPLTVGCTH